jgi:hypothetical protein
LDLGDAYSRIKYFDGSAQISALYFGTLRDKIYDKKVSTYLSPRLMMIDPSSFRKVDTNKFSRQMRLNNDERLGDRLYSSVNNFRMSLTNFLVDLEINQENLNLITNDLIFQIVKPSLVNNSIFRRLFSLFDSDANNPLGLNQLVQKINEFVPHISVNSIEEKYFDYKILYLIYILVGLSLMGAGIYIMQKSNFR